MYSTDIDFGENDFHFGFACRVCRTNINIGKCHPSPRQSIELCVERKIIIQTCLPGVARRPLGTRQPDTLERSGFGIERPVHVFIDLWCLARANYVMSG
jgi:hypothetical protein